MSEVGYHFVGEENTVLELDTGEVITGATVKKIFIMKPDKTEAGYDATIEGTTKLRYTIPLQDQAGTWKAQAYVELPTPWKGRGRTATWEVFEEYATPD